MKLFLEKQQNVLISKYPSYFLFISCLPYVVFKKRIKMPPTISKEKRILFSKFTIILKLSESDKHNFTHGIRLPKRTV